MLLWNDFFLSIWINPKQIKLLEAEKSSIQTNLDDVLELATQQKTSFSEKYEEVNDATL
jgi:centromeric protein E